MDGFYNKKRPFPLSRPETPMPSSHGQLVSKIILFYSNLVRTTKSFLLPHASFVTQNGDVRLIRRSQLSSRLPTSAFIRTDAPFDARGRYRLDVHLPTVFSPVDILETPSPSPANKRPAPSFWDSVSLRRKNSVLFSFYPLKKCWVHIPIPICERNDVKMPPKGQKTSLTWAEEEKWSWAGLRRTTLLLDVLFAQRVDLWWLLRRIFKKWLGKKYIPGS